MKFFKLSILSVAVILSIMLSITSCTGNKSHTDTDNESSYMQSVNDTVIDTKAYSGITTLPSSEVEEFASTVKKAYLDEDWETISSLIDYPITLYPDVKVNNAEEFLSYVKGKHISESDRTAMENETCVDLGKNGEGVFLGSGEVWIRDVNYNGIEQVAEPELRIFGLNGIV